jgi:hypothetical protein
VLMLRLHSTFIRRQSFTFYIMSRKFIIVLIYHRHNFKIMRHDSVNIQQIIFRQILDLHFLLVLKMNSVISSSVECFVTEINGTFKKLFIFSSSESRGSSVGESTGYGLDDGRVGVRVPVGSRTFSSPRRSDLLCGPPSLLSNEYRGLFPRG